jgi:D-serine deaminase-like pyridoxal phosphate-dependent protein
MIPFHEFSSHNIVKPTLIIHKEKAIANIHKMHLKAQSNGVLFRPHFKTHQSQTIGRWFRDEGCSAIAVSSVDMAVYFVADGWKDITITTPINLLQLDQIYNLASEIQLNVVVDNMFSLSQLAKGLNTSTGIFIKIDTGSRRCGMLPSMIEEMKAMCNLMKENCYTHFEGFLIHSGHTYRAEVKEKITQIYETDKIILTELKSRLSQYCEHDIIISTGDTPGCSVVDDLSWADEIRPGNFIFYDLFQWQVGSCKAEDMACVMACPVVGVYPQRNEVVIYGGAVHFSKDRLLFNGTEVYGLSAFPESNGKMNINEQGKLIRIWQEHGLLSFPSELMKSISPGDILFVFPVHSCLAIDAVRNVISSEGHEINVIKY